MRDEHWLVKVEFPDGKTETYYCDEPKEVGEFFNGGKVVYCGHLSNIFSI